MSKNQSPELTILSEKGQVVIPAKIRTRMGLKPKTKFLVYDCDGSIVFKKLEIPELSKEIEAMFKRINQNSALLGEITQEEVDEEIQQYRKEKAKTINQK